ELVVDKAKFQALPEDLQEIVRLCSQAEYDQMASDFYANDPRSLQALVSEHDVQVHQFPDEILQAGAEAAKELLLELRESGDELTKKTTESFIEAFNILRVRTEGTDMPFLAARQKFFQL